MGAAMGDLYPNEIMEIHQHNGHPGVKGTTYLIPLYVAFLSDSASKISQMPVYRSSNGELTEWKTGVL